MTDEVLYGENEAYQNREAAGGLLVFGYFSLAVELEHLGQIRAAGDAYENARTASYLHLGSHGSIVEGIETALDSTKDCDFSRSLSYPSVRTTQRGFFAMRRQAGIRGKNVGCIGGE